ncbi:MAG: hypothetical protein HRU38_21010 [Saccharospirillaceae bacterium]|nr:hypothetical protein [Pseudomonadales bacterium]NRB81112.1 hypothetical protein [Saccharospirillaceae bacterium]
MNHWSKLGIKENSDIKTIKSAYRKKSSEFSKAQYPSVFYVYKEAYDMCIAYHKPQKTIKTTAIKSEPKTDNINTKSFKIAITVALISASAILTIMATVEDQKNQENDALMKKFILEHNKKKLL